LGFRQEMPHIPLSHMIPVLFQSCG
jgi:hypothetical protein